jgi:glucosamine kinase
MTSHHPIRYYLGIDGGGTRCRARLTDAAGSVLGEGQGGPTNIRLGLDLIWGHLLEAIDEALSGAGLTRDAYPSISLGLGLAGITTLEDCHKTVAAEPRFGKAVAATDAHVACLGAFSGRDGAILITGTGSAGYAFIGGTGHGVGGWGFEVCDDGSAASLGREALRAALQGFDGLAPRTQFTSAVLDHFEGQPANIVAFVTTAKPKDYGALAPLVMKYADEGDQVAVELVLECAHDLGRYIARLHELGAEKVCLVGGMAQPLTPWLSPWTKPILSEPEKDAVDGALLLARGAPNGMDLIPASLRHPKRIGV